MGRTKCPGAQRCRWKIPPFESAEGGPGADSLGWSRSGEKSNQQFILRVQNWNDCQVRTIRSCRWRSDSHYWKGVPHVSPLLRDVGVGMRPGAPAFISSRLKLVHPKLSCTVLLSSRALDMPCGLVPSELEK